MEEQLEIIVILTEQRVNPLLGRNVLDLIFPGWRSTFLVSQVGASGEVIDGIKKNFPKILDENRNTTIEGFEANLALKENASPIFHKAYAVPFALTEKVERNLE